MPGIHHSLTIVAQTYPSQPGAGLNEVLVRHFTKQLASALAFLRKDGLVHRDVKPQNLLLNPSPRYAAQNLDPVEMKSSRIAAGIDFLPVLKLADFGFARTLPEASMADTLCGSPLYMAPEILDYQKYDAMVDLWSCGTVLYEMMAGRPPYRAPNHIELLKKIQAGHDKVSFPSACVCSEELRQLARALLKQKPTQRMSFEELFSHPVITNDIPGLVHKTIEPPRSPVRSVEPIRQPEPEEPRRNSSDYRRTVADERAYGVDREQLAQREQRIARQPTLPPSQPAQPTKLDTSALPFATPLDKLQVPPSPNERPAEIRRYTTQTGQPSTPLSPNSQRPGLPAYATAPAREDLVIQRRGTGMERGPSRESNHNTSPGNSLLIHHREYDAQREREQFQRDLQQNARHLEKLQLQQQQREQQEHRDLQRQRSKRGYNPPPSRELRNSEDDYVIVDKQQVQVNAFADELQTARRGGVTPPSANALVRRLSSGGSQQPRSPRGGRPSGEYVHPKGSYERKYGSSPGNAKSALARALEKANLRLFGGIGLSPPNQSPPNIGNTFPGAGPSSLILVNSNINEEDAAVLHVIEENANRADVVYSYAHVKYEQLIPSHPQGLGLVEGGVDIPTNSHRSAELTPDATIMAAEECLVLFVKVLSLLSKAMDVAHAWWATNGLHGEAMSAARANASQRMNNVVQWIRERFNEVLEKSDLVQSKIVEAQRDLPSSHPSHPGNLKKDAQTQQAGGVTSFALTTGVTAEKLMYDRALEMSRAAAVNELVGDDLQGCEVAYVTSLRLLEAILEKREDDGETVEEDDRRVIEKCKLLLASSYSITLHHALRSPYRPLLSISGRKGVRDDVLRYGAASGISQAALGLKVFLEHLLIYIDKQSCQTSTTVTSKSRRKWMPWLEDLRYIHSMDRRVCSIYHLRLLLRRILWLRDRGWGIATTGSDKL